MRKLLLLTLAQMFVLTTFAQKHTVSKVAETKTAIAKSSKPTKQETMDWIASKMQENLIAPRKFVSYSNGQFVYSKMYAGTGLKCVMTIDLNKVTSLSPDYSVDIVIKGNGLIYTACEGSLGNEIGNLICIGGNNYNEYTEPFNFKTDDSIMERVVSAFKALVEFNSVKKKDGEAF